MRKWLGNLMRGRYGVDHLGRFLTTASLILLFVSLIVGSTAGRLLWYLAIASLVFAYYRVFSKNISKRYRENTQYLELKNRLFSWHSKNVTRFKQRKTNRFFRCPNCGITLRVPRGKGKIRVTCPRCKNRFVKKT